MKHTAYIARNLYILKFVIQLVDAAIVSIHGVEKQESGSGRDIRQFVAANR
jgi:hypothetical protein